MSDERAAKTLCHWHRKQAEIGALRSWWVNKQQDDEMIPVVDWTPAALEKAIPIASEEVMPSAAVTEEATPTAQSQSAWQDEQKDKLQKILSNRRQAVNNTASAKTESSEEEEERTKRRRERRRGRLSNAADDKQGRRSRSTSCNRRLFKEERSNHRRSSLSPHRQIGDHTGREPSALRRGVLTEGANSRNNIQRPLSGSHSKLELNGEVGQRATSFHKRNFLHRSFNLELGSALLPDEEPNHKLKRAISPQDQSFIKRSTSTGSSQPMRERRSQRASTRDRKGRGSLPQLTRPSSTRSLNRLLDLGELQNDTNDDNTLHNSATSRSQKSEGEKNKVSIRRSRSASSSPVRKTAGNSRRVKKTTISKRDSTTASKQDHSDNTKLVDSMGDNNSKEQQTNPRRRETPNSNTYQLRRSASGGTLKRELASEVLLEFGAASGASLKSEAAPRASSKSQPVPGATLKRELASEVILQGESASVATLKRSNSNPTLKQESGERFRRRASSIQAMGNEIDPLSSSTIKSRIKRSTSATTTTVTATTSEGEATPSRRPRARRTRSRNSSEEFGKAPKQVADSAIAISQQSEELGDWFP